MYIQNIVSLKRSLSLIRRYLAHMATNFFCLKALESLTKVLFAWAVFLDNDFYVVWESEVHYFTSYRGSPIVREPTSACGICARAALWKR